MTANKRVEQDYETVLAKAGFSSGSHYWEIKLDTFVDMEDIFVGIATETTDLYTRGWNTDSFWGWLCTAYEKLTFRGRQFGPG